MMTFDVEVLLRGTNEVVAETVTLKKPVPHDLNGSLKTS